MTVDTDFLIIGSGIAGLSFALKVAEHGNVALVTKKAVMDSNTNLAQGGIASVFDPLDSFDLHVQDTLASGDGLCDRDTVEMVVTRGPRCIRKLIDLGVDFNLNRSPPTGSTPSEFDLGREGGHSRNRMKMVGGRHDDSVDIFLFFKHDPEVAIGRRLRKLLVGIRRTDIVHLAWPRVNQRRIAVRDHQ